MGIEKWVKPNILALAPYRSARDESSKRDGIFLDANESPFETEYNRYPESIDERLRSAAASVWDVNSERVLLSSGSDEALDWLFKSCCSPGDQIVVCTPSYGMYKVLADIYECEVVEVALDDNYQPQIEDILEYNSAKLLFLNTPNNPIGADIQSVAIVELTQRFSGVVVVDEAYVEFSNSTSCSYLNLPNLIVLRTFSKAWGMAGLRLGGVIASTEWISVFAKVKLPYNISSVVTQKALELLNDVDAMRNRVVLLRSERERLREKLSAKPDVTFIYPSSSNYLTICTEDAGLKYGRLSAMGITVRNRSGYGGLPECLRITVGTPEENDTLLKAWDGL